MDETPKPAPETVKERPLKARLKDFGIINCATLMLIVGTHFFKFPNNFTYGGVTGLSSLLSGIFPFPASIYNFVINMLLLLLGFVFFGRKFGIMTAYVTIITSVSLPLLEWLVPIHQPLTNQPLLELIYAILLPSVSAALLFNLGTSSGGTDIVAMIVKKYTSVNMGMALFIADLITVLATFFVLNAEVALFSMLGLLVKSLLVDNVIASINRHKYFTVICDEPSAILDFIWHKLNRTATIYKAEGAFSHASKTIILVVMSRRQAVKLQAFIRSHDPKAFMLISNTSEIIGKGFPEPFL